jgi:hypothetical protein
MINLYSSAFNLIKNSFEYKDAIDNFCKFADNVAIAVNESSDNTLEELNGLTKQYKNLHVKPVNISYDDPLLDGKIKNEALILAEEIGADYFMGLDLDERLVLNHKERWVDFAKFFLGYSGFDAMLVPSIDLWGSEKTVRWDGEKNKGYKWYIHNTGLKRGPHNAGINPDGTLNISKSDGCELVSPNGELVNAARIDSPLDEISDCYEYYGGLNKMLPYVLHYGFVNYEGRIIRNNNFWKNQWNKCSGRNDVKIAENLEDLDKFELFEHGLELN